MSGETIREGGSATVREGLNSGVTTREGASSPKITNTSAGSLFRDYKIVRQLPSTSTEADIFVVSQTGTEYILKLYRYGIDPKNDVLKSIKTLSEKYPHNFIRVLEADFDGSSERWYEVQEYAKCGTLQAIIDDKSKLDGSQQKNLFNDVARQVGESLNLLHQNNLLHLDVKPSNILLRSLKPLDMVLIDFGIATLLASDMSKKFTQTRGTPMYQSPESYTGGMGRASDWWGLGMILLEIANGVHPFKGLSPNVIAYSVATEPVNIPETLDKGQIELFHGLLTRNPEKRWSWEQVSRWLKGERGIPQYFEEVSSAPISSTVKPFTFMGQKCTSLAEIAAAFARNEEAWEKGRALLMRGNIRTWLEQNGEFESGEDLERNLSNVQDADEKMFQFTQEYGENLPLIFYGKAITLQNLLLFTGKAVRKENLANSEKKIVDMLTSGRLRDVLNSYSKKHRDNDSKALRLALNSSSKSASLSDIAGFLNFYLNPQKYFCPFVKDSSSIEKVIQSSQGLKQPPRPLEYFTSLNEKYVIPKSLLVGTESIGTYHSTLEELDKMERENNLILSSSVERNEKACLASASMNDYMAGVYKWNWGYDEASVKAIDSSLERFRQQVRSASGLEKAQLELWITYLEFLSKKENPLSSADKRILQNVSLKETETLAKRISTIIASPTPLKESPVSRESARVSEPSQQKSSATVPQSKRKKKQVLIIDMIDDHSFSALISRKISQEIRLQGYEATLVITKNARKEIQNYDVVVLVQFVEEFVEEFVEDSLDDILDEYSKTIINCWSPQIVGKNVAIMFITRDYRRVHFVIPSLSYYEQYGHGFYDSQQNALRKHFELTIKDWVARLLATLK